MEEKESREGEDKESREVEEKESREGEDEVREGKGNMRGDRVGGGEPGGVADRHQRNIFQPILRTNKTLCDQLYIHWRKHANISNNLIYISFNFERGGEIGDTPGGVASVANKISSNYNYSPIKHFMTNYIYILADAPKRFQHTNIHFIQF